MYKKVWDLPTRIFHWLLVILIAAAYITSEFFDDDLTYHMWVGYSILTLIIYRFIWGIFGSTTSRFSDFLKSPKVVIDYLASIKSHDAKKYLGHNPAGGWMVVMLLATIFLQASLGLFSSDDIFTDGPLVPLVSGSFVNLATDLHEIMFNILLALIGLHVFAVIFYLLFKKENLIIPMITGKKEKIENQEEHHVKITNPIWACACILIAGSLVWFLVNNSF